MLYLTHKKNATYKTPYFIYLERPEKLVTFKVGNTKVGSLLKSAQGQANRLLVQVFGDLGCSPYSTALRHPQDSGQLGSHHVMSISFPFRGTSQK